MPSFKLIYLDGKARAENIRYLFELAGVQYEDHRIDYEKEWAEQKQNFRFGQLPVLEIDGKRYPQSHAIWRYLARKYGFYGGNNEEALRIDAVCELADELWPFYFKLYKWTEADKQAEVRQEFESAAERVTGYLDQLLRENNDGKGWFIGDKVSLADIMVFNMIYDIIPWLLDIKEGEFDLKRKDALRGFMGRFKANERIAAFIKRRPVSEF